jgi:poly(A) polymerase
MKLQDILDELSNPYIVGGAVRDIIMNKGLSYVSMFNGNVTDLFVDIDIHDVDICTSDTPEEIKVKFPDDYYVIGEKFGTVCLRTDDFGDIEATTFRKEIGGRHPEVWFTDNIWDDLKRRDFTINALALDEKGNITGSWQSIYDLINGIIRSVGESKERIIAKYGGDELRSVRAIRFANRYGFMIENQTAITITQSTLDDVSWNRIRDEIFKMFDDNAANAVLLMDHFGILDTVIPEVVRLKKCNHNPVNHPEGNAFIHTICALKASDRLGFNPLTKFGILLHDIGKPVVKNGTTYHGHDKEGVSIARNIMNRFNMSKTDTDQISFVVEKHMQIHKFEEMRPIKKVRVLSDPRINMLIDVHVADICAKKTNENLFFIYNDIIEYFKFTWENIQPPTKTEIFINGNDLINLGLEPGPGFKTILDSAEEQQILGNISTREEAIEYIQTNWL